MSSYCSRCDGYRNTKYKFEFCRWCAGDWFCKDCKFWNWPQNEVCIKCFMTKKRERDLLICVKCGHEQYFSRCKKCGSTHMEDSLLYKLKLNAALEKMPVLKNNESLFYPNYK